MNTVCTKHPVGSVVRYTPYTHADTDPGIYQRGVHVLIADTVASGSLNQMGPFAGYIIHYHKSDPLTQTGAAWIIKGRYISTCVEVCVWADVIERTKSTKNLSIHIKTPNALHYRQRWCTSWKTESRTSERTHVSNKYIQNWEVWLNRSIWGRQCSEPCPSFCSLSCVVELVPSSEPELEKPGYFDSLIEGPGSWRQNSKKGPLEQAGVGTTDLLSNINYTWGRFIWILAPVSDKLWLQRRQERSHGEEGRAIPPVSPYLLRSSFITGRFAACNATCAEFNTARLYTGCGECVSGCRTHWLMN